MQASSLPDEQSFAALMNRPGLGFEVNRKALDAYSEERI